MNLLYRMGRKITILSLGTLILLTSWDAFAQSGQEPSTAEDVAIAFFKTGDTAPDYDKWAKSTDEYGRTATTRVAEYLYKEKQRLMRRYTEYNPEEDFLNVRSNVEVELKAIEDKDGNITYWLYILPGAQQTVYFPYTFMDYKLAVIPQMFETLMIHQIQKEQLDIMRNDFEGSMRGAAYLYLQLKPVRSYIHQPYKIDGIDQWTLLTDIVSMALRSTKNNQPFWHYGASWYSSPVTEGLKDLYQPKQESDISIP